jgi:glyoxylase-like metal-dependent hydrolase (beta-lactamase superfamily II)
LEGHRTYSFEAVDETKRELEEASNGEEREQLRAELTAWELMTDGLDELTLRYPNETFEQSKMIEGSKRTVQVITYGGGHTDSDVFLWLPDDQIIFMADLLFNRLQPWAGDGNPSEWAEILEKIKTLKPKIWVPGHGAVTDVSTADVIQQYMLALDKSVADAIERGLSAEEIAEIPSPAEFAALDGETMFGRNVQALVEKAST